MKLYILLIALLVLNNVFAKPVVKETKVRIARNYGGYGQTVTAQEPARFVAPAPMRDTGYGQVRHEEPARFTAPVVHTHTGYGQVRHEEPARFTAPVVHRQEPARFTAPVVHTHTGYGEQRHEEPARIVAPAPMRDTSYGQTVVQTPVEIPAPIVQRPVEVPAPVVTSYAAQTPVLRDEPAKIVQVETIDPEWIRLCNEKRTGNSIFYIPHPTRQSFYIQCDEFGGAFLKECPSGLIFTANLVCEDVNNLHPVQTVEHAPLKVAQDIQTGSYGAAPVFAAEQNAAVVTTAVEVREEAPEFRSLCESSRRVGGGSFYLLHPSDRTLYIQCDEFNNAFLKRCPVGLIFSERLTCERESDIALARDEPARIVAPVMDSGYGQQPAPIVQRPVEVPQIHRDVEIVKPAMVASYGAAHTPVLRDEPAKIVQVETVDPEWIRLCNEKRTGNSVFYIAHPTRQTSFIQCDEFGGAFLKDCPSGLIFTANLVCEDVNNLVPAQTAPLRVAQDIQTGSYGAAPVFAAEQNAAVVTTAVEVREEAPEFRSLCESSRRVGGGSFYLLHPKDRTLYIQCDEFNNAFLKRCPVGLIFSERLTCERESDIVLARDEPVAPAAFTAPVQTGYGSAPAAFTAPVEVPVQVPVTAVRAAPEFQGLCAERRLTQTGIFYLTHPTDRHLFIQCDEHGAAYLRECPSGTVFTTNLTCEDPLNIVEVVRPAPVIEAPRPAPIIEAPRPAPIVEAPRAVPTFQADQHMGYGSAIPVASQY